MPIVTQKATSSVFVYQSKPTKNYSSYATIRVDTDPQVISYVYFNRPFPLGATIVSARLEVTQSQPTTGSRQINAWRVSSSWKLSKVNHNNRPGVTGVMTATTLGSGPRGRVWSIDVAPQMQAVADGGAWYGLRVYTDLPTVAHFFNHKSSAYGPRLIVEYVMAPQQPSDLTPANGGAVSIARPTVVFGYASPNASPLTSIQVQANQTVANFTTPSFDSGEIASTLPQYVLPFDVAAGATWFWRVRVKNASGVWSEWSGSAEFIRIAKPALTITTPGVAPNDVVTDPTPPFGWSFTGIQKTYRVRVTDLVSGAMLWDSRNVASVDTAVAYPDSAPVLQPGGLYRVALRVTDEVERVATPGDPIGIEASQDFTFALSPTVASVTGLSAASTPGNPRVTLYWDRVGTPDGWLISRNGVAVAQLDGPDALMSGSRYMWQDLQVGAGGHSWSVAAVVNGQTSQINPITSALITVEGVWLMTLDGENAVRMFGDAPSLDSQEVSAVHLPLGATNPVLITQAIFGRRGSTQNKLKARPGSKLSAELAAWTAMCDREQYPAGTPMVLAWSDTSMRVFIFKTLRDAETEFTDAIPVGFEFCELR